MKILRWLFPHWISKVWRLRKITEIPKEERRKRFWSLLLTGIFMAYLPIIFSMTTGYQYEFVWLWWFPLPFFTTFWWNIPFVLLHSLFLNALAYSAIIYEPVGDRWRIACIRLKLDVPRIDGLLEKEYPDVVASNSKLFRVEAKGYTPEEFMRIKEKISSAAAIFIWAIKWAKDEDNKRLAGYVDFYYSREDLPSHIHISEAPEGKFGYRTGTASNPRLAE